MDKVRVKELKKVIFKFFTPKKKRNVVLRDVLKNRVLFLNRLVKLRNVTLQFFRRIFKVKIVKIILLVTNFLG